MERTVKIEKDFKAGNLHKIVVLVDGKHRYLITNFGRKNFYQLFSLNSFGELSCKGANAKSPDELIELLKTASDLTCNFNYFGAWKNQRQGGQSKWRNVV